MTTIIGHNAIRKPSKAAVQVSNTLCCHMATDNKALMINDPKAALNVGHPSTVSAKINHNMGQSPKTKYKKLISSLPYMWALYQSHDHSQNKIEKKP